LGWWVWRLDKSTVLGKYTCIQMHYRGIWWLPLKLELETDNVQ